MGNSNEFRKERKNIRFRKAASLFNGLETVLGMVTASLAQPKGPTVTVKAEVVDLWCYLEGEDHGPSHKACGTACAKAGNPIGIVDAKGNVYVAVGIKDHQTGQTSLLDKMSETVTVTATLVKKGGTQVLYVKSVE